MGVAITTDQNVTTKCPIAAINGSANATTSRAFVDYVLSAAGQAVLTAAGFQQP